MIKLKEFILNNVRRWAIRQITIYGLGLMSGPVGFIAGFAIKKGAKLLNKYLDIQIEDYEFEEDRILWVDKLTKIHDNSKRGSRVLGVLDE